MKILCIQPGAPYSTNDVFVGYVSALGQLGHDVGVYQLDRRWVHAARYLRLVWRTSGSPPDEKPEPVDVLYLAGVDAVARADIHDPDWVLLFSAMYFDWRLTTALCRYHRVAMVFTESPYDDERLGPFAEIADVAFTNERTSVERLRAFNPNTHYLPAAYDPARHYPDEPDPAVPRHDVVFVGTGFPERIELLRSVDWDGIDLGLYGNWELLGSRNRLRKYLRGGITDNATTAALYRGAKVGLNLYRQSIRFEDKRRITSGESLNPRAYELAACGAFQISDERAESDVLGGGLEMFDAPEQLSDAIRHGLLHPSCRHRRSARALDAVQSHTYLARTRLLLSHLEGHAAKRQAS